jgi:hypothetical protein
VFSSHITSCVKIPCESYRLKQVFMCDAHVESEEKISALNSGVGSK